MVDLATLHPRQETETAVGRKSSSENAKLKIPHAALRYLPALADAGVIIVSSLIGSGGYQFFANQNPNQNLGVSELGAGIVAALLYVFIGQSVGFYDLRAVFSTRRDTKRIFAQWMLAGLLLTLLFFLTKVGGEFSRGSIVCFAFLALMLLLISRSITKRWVGDAVAEGRVQGRRVVVLGSREELASISASELLRRYGLSEVDRVAFAFDKNENLAMGARESASLENAVALARERCADEIVLALPWSDTRKLELVRDHLRASPLPVELIPDRRIRALADNPSFNLKKSLSIEVQRGPLSRLEQFLKRCVDVVGAAIGLMVLSPLMILSAIAIRT